MEILNTDFSKKKYGYWYYDKIKDEVEREYFWDTKLNKAQSNLVTQFNKIDDALKAQNFWRKLLSCSVPYNPDDKNYFLSLDTITKKIYLAYEYNKSHDLYFNKDFDYKNIDTMENFIYYYFHYYK